ncbi:hypothetical protein BCL57_000112 [Agromyces flavus]|uniref:YcxB-like protein n=1 Tax=Agromyces flavus TaxID=589382 RepID=A0A1H1VP30_9MICO|nr:hypothetical protein [Agromyces flavus]MCP2365970.1 hypothetical protein [Agromyces flavus]GGI43743.1 hypothetical protein GCM10010932_01120 [Agromyces flavus]SDS86250.1 hypothetical protein SAMN04489721_2044 [Agromyces flavus]
MGSEESAVEDRAQDEGTREFVAGADTARRLADGYVRYVNTRPVAIAILAALAVVGVVLAVTVFGSWIGAVLLVGCEAVGAWIGVIVQRGRFTRQVRSVAAEGLRMRLDARPDGLWLQTALSEGHVQYGAFGSLVVSGDAVLLKTSNGSSYTVLPAELFPPETLARVRQRISDAAAS